LLYVFAGKAATVAKRTDWWKLMPDAMLSAYVLLTMSVPPDGAVLIVPVVSPIDVMSVFAPDAAAVRFVRAEPALFAPVPPLTTATIPVTFEAVPVVFWLSVGTSAATIVRNVGVPATPSGAARNVLAVCAAKLAAVTTSVPPSVSDPDVVTVPLRLKPLTEPVPDTDVTVPVVELVPAPMAVRNVGASNAETVLSALKRGKVIADGSVKVKTLPPMVVAPRLTRALGAVVAPVPPLAIASVPPIVIVPPAVIGPPLVVRPVVPPLTSTLVTVPAPVPLAPVGPVGPATVDASPVGPVGPPAPVVPVGPVGPVGPVLPVGPIGPDEPVGPVIPCAPVGPVAPVMP